MWYRRSYAFKTFLNKLHFIFSEGHTQLWLPKKGTQTRVDIMRLEAV